MAHAQKPDLVFQRNGRVHLNWRRRQFSRLLAAEVCPSAVVMVTDYLVCNGSNAGYTMFWGRVQDYWLPTPLACFPFTSPTVRHRVPSGFNCALPDNLWRYRQGAHRGRYYRVKLCIWIKFLISNFRRVPNVVCFLLGNSPALNFICRRFGTMSHLHRQAGMNYIWIKVYVWSPNKNVCSDR